jgi:hypothetical protein
MYKPSQLAFLYATMIASMLLGASVVHGLVRPNLALPLPPK